jgi:hypothetical protein
MHGFCVTCGQHVVAYIGSYRAYEYVRREVPPMCYKHETDRNYDSNQLRIWHDYSYEPKEVPNASHE